MERRGWYAMVGTDSWLAAAQKIIIMINRWKRVNKSLMDAFRVPRCGCGPRSTGARRPEDASF